MAPGTSWGVGLKSKQEVGHYCHAVLCTAAVVWAIITAVSTQGAQLGKTDDCFSPQGACMGPHLVKVEDTRLK